MDRRVAKPRRRAGLVLAIGAAIFVLVGSLVAVFVDVEESQIVDLGGVELATVTEGTFRDELLTRAIAVPWSSVLLDSTAAARVEAVLVQDGEIVKRGQILYRLVNPALQQELLARESDVAQQTANLIAIRSGLETARTEHRRRIAELTFELERQTKSHARSLELAAKGFLSTAVIDDSNDRLLQQQKLAREAVEAYESEMHIREQAVLQMQGLLTSLKSGLRLSKETLDGLNVKAPIDGLLTDFRLREGESVKAGDNLGRIDSPDRFKLMASIDEFYVDRIQVAMKGVAQIAGANYPVTVARINPQLHDGRFSAELHFASDTIRDLRSGTNVDVLLEMGDRVQALVLPDGPFYREGGASSVFKVDQESKSASRKAVKLGRRAHGQVEVLEGLYAGDRIITSTYAPYAGVQKLKLSRRSD